MILCFNLNFNYLHSRWKKRRKKMKRNRTSGAWHLVSMAAWRGVTRRHGNNRHRHLVRSSLSLLTPPSLCFLLMRLLGGDWAVEGCGNVSYGLQTQQAWPWWDRRRNKKRRTKEGERKSERKDKWLKKRGDRKCYLHVFGPQTTELCLFEAMLPKKKNQMNQLTSNFFFWPYAVRFLLFKSSA